MTLFEMKFVKRHKNLEKSMQIKVSERAGADKMCFCLRFFKYC